MPRSLRSPEQQCLQERLTSSRRRKALTQADVAQRLGRPQSFVAKYEKGERRLDLIEFTQIAFALGEDPAQLFAALLDDWVKCPPSEDGSAVA